MVTNSFQGSWILWKKNGFCEVSWNIIFFAKTMIVSLSPQEPSVAQWERVYYDVMIRRSYIIIVVWLLSGESSFFRLFCLWFFSFLLRKGHYWFSWDRIWKNRCICTASSSDTARKSSEVICSRSYSDKVRLGPMLVLHKDYTYLYTSHI